MVVFKISLKSDILLLVLSLRFKGESEFIGCITETDQPILEQLGRTKTSFRRYNHVFAIYQCRGGQYKPALPRLEIASNSDAFNMILIPNCTLNCVQSLTLHVLGTLARMYVSSGT